jgi:transcriptional regulator with XRE-family HTH domain
MQGRPPAPETPAKPAKERTLPIDKDAFAQRLWQAIKRSGLTYKETARRAQEHLPPGMRISDVSVWSYAKGRSLPRRMTHVEALGRVLGVDTQELLGTSELSAPTGSAEEAGFSGVHVDDLGNGRAMLRIAMPAPWPVALEVLQLLKGHEHDTGSDDDGGEHAETDAPETRGSSG